MAVKKTARAALAGGEGGKNFLGSRIRLLRGDRSQDDVARAAGVDKATISKTECGHNENILNPTLEKIVRGLRIPGLTVAKLRDPAFPVTYGGAPPRLPETLKTILEQMQEQIEDLYSMHRDLRREVRALTTKGSRSRRVSA